MSSSETPASPSPASDSVPAGEPIPPATAEAAPASTVSEPSPSQPASSEPAPVANDIDEYEPLTPEIVEEEAIRGDFVLRWAVVLLAFLLGSTRIGETGTLVHVKTGQYLASHGVLPPANDVFSYTAQERSWTNLSWGFDLLAAGVHAIGSFTGLSILKAVVMALVFWLIGRISRANLPTWWGSICGGAALLACQSRILAEPSLITYLGIALLLTIWFRWRESLQNAGTLWLAVPLLVVWSNLDPRAFLGWGLLALYALGDGLAAFLQSPGALPAQPRKTLWLVTAAAAAATMLHPFGWKSLAAPWRIYGIDYPALRGYITEAFIGNEVPAGGSALAFFPMTTETFWTGIDLTAIAALALFAAALITLIMNYRRLDWGQVAVLLGFGAAAFACLHELPVAAIVAAVLATINGQEWYAASCRQTYSIETSELVFSRGGRALTVLTLAGIAFFSGTGRLPGAAAAGTGYGLAHDLKLQLDDLQKQLEGDASFDHKPFNTYLTQGDQLLWIGEQVFADSRVAVYFSPEDDENLLRQHLLVRDALRPRRESGGMSGTRRSVWSKVLNEYGVTHAVVRLLSDYRTFAAMLADTVNWEWTGLGSANAVFYRRDSKTPGLGDFVTAHKLDFRKRAFRENWLVRGTEEGIVARERSIRPPSFYQRYFWRARRQSPAAIHEGMHLARLASYPALPQALDSSRLAMAYLAVRLAQEGLSYDPDAVDGYVVLGMAYDFLSTMEAGSSPAGMRHPRTGMRYFQSVAAYNQALVGDPENFAAHLALRKLYREAGRPDLELRHLEAIDKVLSENLSDEQAEEALLTLGNDIRRLRESLKEIDDAMAQQAAAEPSPLQLAGAYFQRGCVLRALRELERDGGNAAAGNLRAEQFRIRLLLESGRVDEAFEAGRRFADAAKQAGVPGWADEAALSSLPNADYFSAMGYWQDAAEQAEKIALSGLVQAVAPHNGSQPWPISTINAAYNYQYQRPETVAALKMNVALLQVEQGRIEAAEHDLHEVLAANPDSPSRPLVRYYLSEMTDGKEQLDLIPPSDRVVELFASDDEE